MGALQRTILIDRPSLEDGFNGQGHQRTAVALSKAIAKFSGADRAIGLDGPWGSGKSTVVEIARKILADRRTPNNRDYRFFTFDIWQSQGSSFRRSLLEHFLDWTIKEFPKHRAELQEVERNVKGKVRQVHSTNQSILDWWGVIVIAALPFLPLYYIWAKYEFDNATADAPFSHSYSFLLIPAFLSLSFLSAASKMIRERRMSGGRWWRGLFSRYRVALSQTLLIGSKQFEDQKVTQYIRETDPNDFEFQTTLREILSIVQSDKVRVVIVLDNIDRLPKMEIDDYWAQVRAVFSGNPSAVNTDPKRSVTVIVPYHRHLIGKDTVPDLPTDGVAAISPLGSREIFTKTFDEILQVSPPVMSNSRDFFVEKIRQALPNATDTDELFRVYLIFDRIIRDKEGSATPRQIIAFVNELCGMYVLHEGKFKLPTVAVYIAYQDALEAKPALLNNPNSIDRQVRRIANDSVLEQNLAAIIFNVDADLALQLMVDQRIKDAAVHSPDRLIEIANSAGFDVRVDQVVQENTHEWRDSGELPLVTSNFAALSKVYNGAARAHFCSSLVSVIVQISKFALEEDTYNKLLEVFDFADRDKFEELTEALLNASLGLLGNDHMLQPETGVAWAKFLGTLHRKLERLGALRILEGKMNSVRVPGSPRFNFGLAASAVSEGINFNWLTHYPLDFQTEPTLFPELAVDRPGQMRAALLEMEGAELLDDEMLTSVFDGLLERLKQPEVGNHEVFREQIQLMAEIYTYLPTERRSGLNITSLFEHSPFFEHLVQAVEKTDDTVGGSALFLALQMPGQKALNAPVTRLRNATIVSGDTPEFRWFSEALTSGKDVSVSQYRRVAELTKSAKQFGLLIQTGATDGQNHFVNEVIRHGIVEGYVPWLTIQTFNAHYTYLKTLAGEKIQDVLIRFEPRFLDEHIAKIDIEKCSIELLHDVRTLNTSNWSKLRHNVSARLQNVPADGWEQHIRDNDKHSQLLMEMVEGSNFRVAEPGFRDVVVRIVLDVLGGVFSPSSSYRLDILINAIEDSFHPDMYRQMREGAKDVNQQNLSVAKKCLPETTSQIVRSSERLSKEEKDGLVRFFLCPALEGQIDPVLKDFEALGYMKVKEIVASSHESTKNKLEGAISRFASAPNNSDRARSLGELLYGKRKGRSLFERWFSPDHSS